MAFESSKVDKRVRVTSKSSRTARKCSSMGRSERGAIFVELAFALPLTLGLIFGVVWLSQLSHADTTLTAAVGNSLRLGITRGDYEELGADVVSVVQSYIVDGNAPDPRLNELLVSSDLRESSSFESFEELYNDPELGIFEVFSEHGDYSIRNISPQYMYALIYINAHMKNSLGSQVRYPCDPEGEDGAGCLLCRFRNPDFPQLEPEDANFFYDVAGWDDFPRRISIDCRYRPDNIVSSVVASMLGMLSASGTSEPGMLVFRRMKAGYF